MDLFSLSQKKLLLISITALVAVLVTILVGYLVAPTLFYDQWIWKYYWGPIVSDAAGHPVTHNGVTAQQGYTILSEITYGIILIISLFIIYNILKKLKIVVDWRFCLSLLPFIIFGPVTRVLEDTQYFEDPFVYWFISPLIYVQIGLVALFFVFLGYFFSKRSNQQKQLSNLIISVVVFLKINIFVTMLWVFGTAQQLYSFEPWVLYAISSLCILPLIYGYGKRRVLSVNTVVFSGGLLFLFPSLYLTGRWIAGDYWGFTYGVRFDVFLLVMGLVSLIVFLVYMVSSYFKNNENLVVYQNPLNLAMIAGHLIDGIATYISIYDPLSMNLPLYMEKHPASNAVLELWPPLFPIIKFILIVVVIYIFDILYKKELQNHQRFVNLMKIAIVILGFSPGVRNLLRVTMGV